MKAQFRILFLLFFSTGFLHAQGAVFNIWHFGQWGGLSFNGPVTAIGGGQCVTTEGSASIADATGALLFYTDGVTVWDRTHTQMPNGFGLSGDVSTTQSALIVQRPGSTTLYYVFTVPADGALTDLRYSIVNMTLNGGFGDVVVASKNTLMAAGNTVAEKITAIKHCNNVDWWIVTHGLGNNSYRSWLLSAAGVSGAPVVSSTGTVITTALNRGLGWMTASHDGTKIVLPSYSGGTVDIVNFNNATAAVSGAKIMSGLVKPYGTEFSANDQVLYVTCDDQLKQFNASLATGALIQASQVILATEANMMRAIRMAPNGKIYVCREWDSFLGVINNPNTLGAGCGYNPFGIDLSVTGGFNSLGLPNNYKFYNICAPLAVEWLSFEAELLNSHMVKLTWATATEMNSYKFIIERSSDGVIFDEIGRIDAAGNSNTTKYYEFMDDGPLPGTSYYRIREMDYDWGYTESAIRAIENNADGNLIVLYPNPASDYVQLSMPASFAEMEMDVLIYDATGKLVQTISKKAFQKNVVIDVKTFDHGIYFIHANDQHLKLLVVE